MKFVLFFLLALGAALQAQPELPPGPVPPNAKPVEVSVVRGASVDIPLEADRRTTRQLRFVIRQPPTLGSLSEVRPTDAHTAVVTYTHSGDPESEMDQFRFAAGAPGLGYSAHATITIRITNPPARLRAPAKLDLGKILQGDPAGAKLVLQNSGGEQVEGIISVPAPWQVQPADIYKIEPGESAEFDVQLLNAAAGKFDGIIRYSSHPMVRTSLHAEVIDPFSLEPSTLEKDDWEEGQTAEISITNFTPFNQKFKIIPPDGIDTPSVLTVPAQSTAILALTISDLVRARGGTSITLNSELRTLTIPIAVPDLPPATEPQSILPLPPGLATTGQTTSPPTPPRPIPPQSGTPHIPEAALPPPVEEAWQDTLDPGIFKELGMASQPNPVATGLQITKLKPTRVTLAWQAKSPLQALDYKIESLTLVRDRHDELVAQWELAPFKPRPGKSGIISVTIDQLTPESIYHFRIISDRFTPEDAEPFSPAFAPPILTPPKQLSAAILVCLVLGGAALAGAIFWKLRQNRVDVSS